MYVINAVWCQHIVEILLEKYLSRLSSIGGSLKKYTDIG